MRIVRKNSRIYSIDVRNVMASRIGFFFLLTTLTLAGRVAPPIDSQLVGYSAVTLYPLLLLASLNANQSTSQANYVVQKPNKNSRRYPTLSSVVVCLFESLTSRFQHCNNLKLTT